MAQFDLDPLPLYRETHGMCKTDPLTMRAIPKRFCDGVGWLADKETLCQVSFTFTSIPYMELAGLELVRDVSRTSSRLVALV